MWQLTGMETCTERLESRARGQDTGKDMASLMEPLGFGGPVGCGHTRGQSEQGGTQGRVQRSHVAAGGGVCSTGRGDPGAAGPCMLA